MPMNPKQPLFDDYNERYNLTALYASKHRELIKFIKKNLDADSQIKPIGGKLNIWITDCGTILDIKVKYRGRTKQVEIKKVKHSRYFRGISVALIVAHQFLKKTDRYISFKDGNNKNITLSNLEWIDTNYFEQENQQIKKITNDRSDLLQKDFGDKANVRKSDLAFLYSVGVRTADAMSLGTAMLKTLTYGVFVIELEKEKEAFIGYAKITELYKDNFLIDTAKKIPWLRNRLTDNSSLYFIIKQLGVGYDKDQSRELCSYFINKYYDNNWQIINEDWKSGLIDKQITLNIGRKKSEMIREKIKNEFGYDKIETYLRFCLKKLI